MKSYFVRFILLAVFIGFCSLSYAQSSTEIIKQKVDEALTTYIQKIYPPKNCPNNGSTYFYKKNFRITKNMEVGNTLRLWGTAETIYRNARTGVSENVLFYTEVNKIDGVITVTKLKWQVGPCMKFEPLFEI